MITHSFVDESKTSTYMLVAVLTRPANLGNLRREVSSLVLPRQRRIHFHGQFCDGLTDIAVVVHHLRNSEPLTQQVMPVLERRHAYL